MRLPDQRVTTDLEIISHGVAGAYRVTDRLSLGLGVSYFSGTQEIRTEAYRWDSDTAEAFFGQNSFLPERRWFDAGFDTDGEDWSLTGGVLWRIAERWSLGAFYRQGPEFDGVFRFRTGPTLIALPPGTLITVDAPLAFPDAFGMGLAFGSRGGSWSVSFEWDWIEYSVVFESVREIARPDTRFNFPGEIDDGVELRLGTEYLFLQSQPLLAVRLGLWRDPDHRVHSDAGPFEPATLPPGDDEVHYAIGFGAAFERFQIDLGADFSDLRDTIALSAIYKF